MKKRIWASVLTLTMLLGLLPTAALAEEFQQDPNDVPVTYSDPADDEVAPQATTEPSAPEVSKAPVQLPDAQNGAITLESGDYTLSKDVTASIVVPSGVTATLDLNGKTLNGQVTSKGDLTIKDSTAVKEPSVSDNYSVSEYSSGMITYKDAAVVAQEGGTVTLESGTICATGGNGLNVVGNEAYNTWSTAVASTANIEGGYIKSTEYGAGAYGNGAVLNITGGVIEASDNAAVAGNGSCDGKINDGGTTINISGGTAIGHITSSGYIAVGIYHPQSGVLNITGGTVYADNGVGICIRNGELNISDDAEIIASGHESGKVGDAANQISGKAVVIDYATGYNHNNESADTRKVNISGGKFTADEACIDVYTTSGNKVVDKFITGGTFSSEPDKSYIATEYEAKKQEDGNYKVVPKSGMSAETTSTSGTANSTVSGELTGSENKDEDNVGASGSVLTIDAKSNSESNSVTKSNVEIGNVALKSVADASLTDIMLDTDVAQLDISSAAWKHMAEQASDDAVELTIEKVAADETNKTPLTYKLTAQANNKSVYSGEGTEGYIEVFVPYDGETASVYYVGENGALEDMDASVDTTKKELSWRVTHFSDYIVLTSESEATYTAEDGTTKTGTLAEAVANAKAGSTVTLVTLNKNVELDGTGKTNNQGVLTINKNLTIDGKGCTISAKSITVDADGKGPSLINVENTSDVVTLKNVKLNGGNAAKHCLNVYKSKVALEKVEITGARWYAVEVGDTSEVTIDGLTTSGNGWGINVDKGGKLTINKANIGEEASIVYENSGENNTGSLTVKDGTYNDIILQGADVSGTVKLENGKFNSITKSEGTTVGTNVVTVSGGTYADPVDKSYLDSSLNAELKSSDGYRYYESLEEAQKDAKPGDSIKSVAAGSVTDGIKITLKYNDGTTSDTVYEGFTSVTLPTPTREGYTFNGWYSNGQKYSGTVTFTAPTTLTAQWTKKSSGGSSSGGSSSSSGSSGNAVSVPSKVSNGTVTVSPKNADKGTTVTITVKPDSGYQLKDLTVTDKDGNKIALTDKGNGKYTFPMPKTKVDVAVSFEEIPTPVGPKTTYVDVPDGMWYTKAVAYVTDKGIMSGIGDQKFGPDVKLTRAMLMTMLARLDGVDTTGGSTWYEKGRAWAMEKGVSDGTDPEGTITREQLVSMLYRYAKMKGIDVSVGEDTNILSYADAQSISGWAMSAMQWACGAGVINGTSDVTLSPLGSASRAEVAAMFMNYLENVAK